VALGAKCCPLASRSVTTPKLDATMNANLLAPGIAQCLKLLLGLLMVGPLTLKLSVKAPLLSLECFYF